MSDAGGAISGGVSGVTITDSADSVGGTTGGALSTVSELELESFSEVSEELFVDTESSVETTGTKTDSSPALLLPLEVSNGCGLSCSIFPLSTDQLNERIKFLGRVSCGISPEKVPQ